MNNQVKYSESNILTLITDRSLLLLYSLQSHHQSLINKLKNSISDEHSAIAKLVENLRVFDHSLYYFQHLSTLLKKSYLAPKTLTCCSSTLWVFIHSSTFANISRIFWFKFLLLQSNFLEKAITLSPVSNKRIFTPWS